MTEHIPYLLNVRQHDSVAARLVYADWLAENGYHWQELLLRASANMLSGRTPHFIRGSVWVDYVRFGWQMFQAGVFEMFPVWVRMSHDNDPDKPWAIEPAEPCRIAVRLALEAVARLDDPDCEEIHLTHRP